MKEMDDAELQKWLEENRQADKTSNSVSDDATAYQFLFNILNTGPEKGPSYDFSAKVTRKVYVEAKRSSELKYYLTGLVIFAVFAAAIYAVVSIVKLGASASYVDAMLKYKWVFILGISSFLTIQYLDVVLVKQKVFRKSS